MLSTPTATAPPNLPRSLVLQRCSVHITQSVDAGGALATKLSLLAIFRATLQPRSRFVAPAAAADVLENGISTATRTRCTCQHAMRQSPHIRPHAAPKSFSARPPSLLRPHPAQRHAGQRLGPGRFLRARRAEWRNLAPQLAAPGAGALCPPSDSPRWHSSRRPCVASHGGAAKWPRAHSQFSIHFRLLAATLHLLIL